jgi:hypothetical protein
MKLQIRFKTHQIATLKYNTEPNNSMSIMKSVVPPLNKEETKYVQAVVDLHLYYARAVDSTILPALRSLATMQAKPTQNTIERVKQLLDYCATQEDAIVTYLPRKMILCIHSNAGYCNKKNAQSRAGGHFFLSNNNRFPPNNGAMLTNATIIKIVMSSAAEAELGALFLNAKEAVYLCHILTEMGHQLGCLAIKKLCRKKIGGKGENLVWPLLLKILCFSDFFEPITTQSQPNHVSIFFNLTILGPPNSLFFARFGINTPSPKSRGGCKISEPILVPLLNRFVHTSGTSRWWSGQSNLYYILSPAEKLCTHAPKIARHVISHTPIL